MIFDTHAHYNDEQFDNDRNEILASMPDNNVSLILNACSQLSEMPQIIEMVDKFPHVYGAVGVHPEAVNSIDDTYLDKITQYTKHQKIVAIGEIGLDYYWTTETKEKQQQILGEQIDLARELNMPVIIHDREAHGDIMRILTEHKVWECGGVFHCYSGSAEMVKEITKNLGMYIAFGGTVTFKNAVRPREALKAVPLDRLLIETDAPYLAPVPYRGKRNSSVCLKEVVAMISEITGLPTIEIERITTENGKRLFSI